MNPERKLSIVVRNEVSTLSERRIEDRDEQNGENHEAWLDGEQDEILNRAKNSVNFSIEHLTPVGGGYFLPGKERPKKRTVHDLFNDRIKDSRSLIEEKIPYTMERLNLVKRILPHLQLEFFIAKINEISAEAGTPVDEKIDGDESERRNQLEQLALPEVRFELILDKITEVIQEEAEKYFRPLLERAKGDVKQYFIKYARSLKISPEEVQQFLEERFSIDLPIEYHFSLRNYGGMDKNTVADTDTTTIMRFNLDNSLFTDNGKGNLDEVSIAETMIHELLHNFSQKFDHGNYGLQDPSLFEGAVRNKKDKSPETYLNEITTEMTALSIGSKYYDPQQPGVLRLNRKPEQQTWGYKDKIDQFVDLKKKFPGGITKLEKLLVDGMLRGKIEEVKVFFRDNPDIYEEVKSICLPRALEEVA